MYIHCTLFFSSDAQSISPGIVRTEFKARKYKLEDVEQSKKDYDKILKDVCLFKLNCNSFFLFF